MRKQISNKEIKLSIEEFVNKLYETLNKKGYGTFSSIHEISGILREEYLEFDDSIHNNDHKKIVDELFDIAVVAVFGISCIKSKSIDW
jgi:uncharacterized protein (UPF0297 family)